MYTLNGNTVSKQTFSILDVTNGVFSNRSFYNFFKRLDRIVHYSHSSLSAKQKLGLFQLMFIVRTAVQFLRR